MRHAVVTIACYPKFELLLNRDLSASILCPSGRQSALNLVLFAPHDTSSDYQGLVMHSKHSEKTAPSSGCCHTQSDYCFVSPYHNVIRNLVRPV